MSIEIIKEAKEILPSLKNDIELLSQQSPQFREWWINYLNNHYGRYLDVCSFLDEDDKKRKIIEIGSVPGHLTVLLKKLGFDVQGVDIFPVRVQSIWDKYHIPVDKIDIEKESLPFESQSFDIVLFTEMIEHLRINPLNALREIFRILTPDGWMLLSTPYINPLQRIDFLLGLDYQGNPVVEFKKLEYLGHMGHIRLYSFNEIKKFLECVGFKIVFHTNYMKNKRHKYLYVIAKKDIV